MLIEKFTFQITHAIRAVGRIKEFQVTETAVLLLNIPLAYFAFKAGSSPVSIFLIGIILTLLLFFVRLYFGKKVANINIILFIRNAIVPVVIPISISVLLVILPVYYVREGFWRFLLVFTIFFISFSVSFWIYGLTNNEKNKLKSILSPLINKYHV